MAIDVKLEEAAEEATILTWHKNQGDNVSEGEKLVDIETAKATVEVESQNAGTIKEILKNAGDTITSDDVVAVIE